MIAAVIDGVKPLLANVRSRSGWVTHKAVEDQLVNLAKVDAAERARQLGGTVRGPVIATLIVTPPERDSAGRRRAPAKYPDVDGYQPTLKRMLDGVVRAGLLRDDDPTIVTEVRTRQAAPGPRWRLELHLYRDTSHEDRR